MVTIDISDYKSQYGLLILIGLFAIGFFTPYYLFFLSHHPLSILSASEEYNGNNAHFGCASANLNQSVIAYSFFGADNYQITSYFSNLKENIDDRIPKNYKGNNKVLSPIINVLILYFHSRMESKTLR